MNTGNPGRYAAYFCLALSMSLVGSYVALSKPLAAALPVFLLAWLRFGIGVVAMMHWLKKPEDEPPLDRKTRFLLFLESLLGNFLFTIFMIHGVALTGGVTAGVVMASIPAIVAILSWIFLHEQVGLRGWLAVFFAIAGIALMSLSGNVHATVQQTRDATESAWLGYALLLAAAFCEAAYSVIGKRLTGKVGPRRITALINLWGFALATPLGLYTAWDFDFLAVTGGTWALLLFYSLAACMWTVWLWMTGLRTVAAAQAGVFTVFLPISAALTGVVMLGESLQGTHYAAFMLAMTGVLLATVPTRRGTTSSER